MKLLTVVGTRPNIVKEAPINRLLRQRGIEEVLVHTGQHFDPEMSDIFFQELSIPTIDFQLHVPTGMPGKQTAAMLEQIEEILQTSRPDVMLVYGDVTSTLAGALAAARLKVPVAHVEAGIRTKNRMNPEEINRRVTDILSDLLFANVPSAYQNLVAEGFMPDQVHLSGDVMQDVLFETLEKLRIPVRRGDYHVATVHREENVDNPQRLTQIVEGFVTSGERVLFPLHPRTEKNLKRFNLWERLTTSQNVEILPALGYIDFIKLLAGANKVLTDSGGVRREAYLLYKPVIVLIDMVWFPEIAEVGWKQNTGSDAGKIREAIWTFEPQTQHPALFGDGQAHVKIVDALCARYGDR